MAGRGTRDESRDQERGGARLHQAYSLTEAGLTSAREPPRTVPQLSYAFALIDLLPYGRQEEWQDSPEGWPQSPTYSRWAGSQDVAALYGPDA